MLIMWYLLFKCYFSCFLQYYGSYLMLGSYSGLATGIKWEEGFAVAASLIERLFLTSPHHSGSITWALP